MLDSREWLMNERIVGIVLMRWVEFLPGVNQSKLFDKDAKCFKYQGRYGQ